MSETLPSPHGPDKATSDAEKRVRKIKKFYKELATWAGTSVFLIALDLFLSGGLSWSKYPVFFWGIAIAYQFFQVLRIQKLDREWEKKMVRKLTKPATRPDEDRVPDYSDELLNNQRVKEKELEDLKEYRTLKKPWKDEDLV